MGIFLGRKDNVDPVDVSALAVTLDLAFAKEMGPLEPRASAILVDLHVAKERFLQACYEFEKLDAEPYTEDLWMPNINSIKSQKAQYASALTEAAKDLSLDADKSIDVYGRYSRILSNVEAMIGNVLKTNAKFKQSFYCYSKYLGNFKKAYASLERLESTLRSELDRKSAGFQKYSALRSDITALQSSIEELDVLREGISAMKAGATDEKNSSLAGAEADTMKKLAEKESELSVTALEGSEVLRKINLLTAPLARPSRKLDHMTVRRRSLNAFVEDPLGAIKSEKDYAEFIDLLKELKKNVESGSIDSKNRDELLGNIAVLMESDIYQMLISLKDIELKKSGINLEKRELERIIERISAARSDVEQSGFQLKKMESDYVRIAASISSLKSGIEKSFADGYGMRISIILKAK
jgi:hypothetical protein